MKAVAFLMCLLGSSLAAPAPDSGSNEQAIISHANTALQMMELYRMLGHLRQQAAPAAPVPIHAQPPVSPQAPQQGIFFNPALSAPTGDGSDEEGAVPAVAVEIDTTLVGPDATAGADQVLVADALPVQ